MQAWRHNVWTLTDNSYYLLTLWMYRPLHVLPRNNDNKYDTHCKAPRHRRRCTYHSIIIIIIILLIFSIRPIRYHNIIHWRFRLPPLSLIYFYFISAEYYTETTVVRVRLHTSRYTGSGGIGGIVIPLVHEFHLLLLVLLFLFTSRRIKTISVIINTIFFYGNFILT